MCVCEWVCAPFGSLLTVGSDHFYFATTLEMFEALTQYTARVFCVWVIFVRAILCSQKKLSPRKCPVSLSRQFTEKYRNKESARKPTLYVESLYSKWWKSKVLGVSAIYSFFSLRLLLMLFSIWFWPTPSKATSKLTLCCFIFYAAPFFIVALIHHQNTTETRETFELELMYWDRERPFEIMYE